MKNKEEDNKRKEELKGNSKSSFVDWELTINPNNIKKEPSKISEDSERKFKAFMKEWIEENPEKPKPIKEILD